MFARTKRVQAPTWRVEVELRSSNEQPFASYDVKVPCVGARWEAFASKQLICLTFFKSCGTSSSSIRLSSLEKRWHHHIMRRPLFSAQSLVWLERVFFIQESRKTEMQGNFRLGLSTHAGITFPRIVVHHHLSLVFALGGYTHETMRRELFRASLEFSSWSSPDQKSGNGRLVGRHVHLLACLQDRAVSMTGDLPTFLF